MRLISCFLLAVIMFSCDSAMAQSTNKDSVYAKTDKMPEPGYNVSDYLAKNIHYPKEARKKNIEGKVVIKFIIDKEGNVTHPVILKSPDTLLSQESLRVVKIMPRWVPAEVDGERVRV